MTEQEIRAYIWQDIIRLGFSPTGEKDQLGWLYQFGRSLKEFWEISCYPPTPTRDNRSIIASFNCGSPDLCLQYTVTSSSKFVVHFLYTTKDLMWIHDVDGEYFTFPTQSFLDHYGRRKDVPAKFKTEDVEAVVDGLLIHPAAHLHLESPIDQHEIRIGGGIDNPFQYLFHLRYQLCPSSEKRHAERNRLVELFADAIIKNLPISAAILLGQPRM